MLAGKQKREGKIKLRHVLSAMHQDGRVKQQSGNKDVSAAAAALGSRGGKARAKALSPAARKQIAQAAAQARWGNNKKTAAKRPQSKP